LFGTVFTSSVQKKQEINSQAQGLKKNQALSSCGYTLRMRPPTVMHRLPIHVKEMLHTPSSENSDASYPCGVAAHVVFEKAKEA
jgi:hypothetical protein